MASVGFIGRFQENKGFAAYLFLLVILVLSLDLIFQVLWSKRLLLEQESSVTMQLSSIRGRLEESVYANLLLIHGVAAHISIDPEINQERFEALAREIMRQPNFLKNLAAAPDFTIKYVFPIKGNEQILGVNYQDLPTQWDKARLARETGRLVLAGPFELLQGGLGLVGRAPVFTKRGSKEIFWGLVSAALDFNRLLETAGVKSEDNSLDLAISGIDGDNAGESVFWGDSGLFAPEVRAVRMTVNLPNDIWSLAARPKYGWRETGEINYLIHLAFFLFLTSVIYLSIRKRQKEKQLERAQLGLARSQATAHLGNWEWDSGKDEVRLSDEAYNVLTLESTPDGLSYEAFLNCFHPEERSRLEKVMRDGLEEGRQPEECELRLDPGRRQGRIVVLIRDGSDSVQQSAIVTGTLQDITESKNTEAWLKEARQHIYDILESTTDAFFEVDANFNLTYINTRAEQSLRIKSADSIGRYFWDLFPQSVGTVFHQEYERALREQKVAAFEAYDQIFDLWYDVRAYPTPTSLSVYFNDITLRKRLQVERENIFQLSQDMICIAGSDGFFKEVNPSWKKTLGWETREFLERPWLDFVHPDDRASTIKAGEKLLNGGDVTSFENRYKCRDGSYKWLSWNSFSDREAGRIYSVVRDVTERNEYMQALSDSEERFRTLVEHSPLGMVLTDSNGDIIYLNPSFSDMFGYTTEDLPHILDFWRLSSPDETSEALSSFWEKISEPSKSYPRNGVEKKVMSKKRTWMDIELNYVPVGDRGMSIFSDITARKRAEAILLRSHEELERLVGERTAELARLNQELLVAKEEAEAGSRAKTHFLSNISHELRTPLNPIIGLTELLMERNQAPENVPLLEDIRLSAVNLLKMFNDLIEIAHFDAHGGSPSPNAFSLEGIMESLAEGVRGAVRDKDISVDYHLEDGLPRLLFGDWSLIQKALDRICENAAKFTETGTISLEAAREKQPLDDGRLWIRFTVRDTGAGIPAGRLESLFQDFTQADGSMTRRFGGLGLGITLARRITAGLGGKIRAESVEGQGSAFHISLPLPEFSPDMV